MPFPILPDLKVEMSFVDAPFGVDPDDTVSIIAFAGWADITSDVRRVSINRGRADDLQKVSSGTASLTLSNATRKYDPLNTASVYYGYLKPRRSVRVTAIYPNDSIVDNFCYERLTLEQLTESGASNNVFIYGGLYMYATKSLQYTGVSNFYSASATSVSILAHIAIEPASQTWLTMEIDVASVFQTIAVTVILGVIKIYKWSGGAWLLSSSATLPAVVTGSGLPIWVKATMTSTTTTASYCFDQDKTPEFWTDLAMTDSSVGGTITNATSKFKIGAQGVPSPGAQSAFVAKRMVVQRNGTTVMDLLLNPYITLFRGFNTAWQTSFDVNKDATVDVPCSDLLGSLGNMNLPPDPVTPLFGNNGVLISSPPYAWWRLGDGALAHLDYKLNANQDPRDLVSTLPVAVADSIASGLQGSSSLFQPTTANGNPIKSGNIAPLGAGTEFTVSLWFNTSSKFVGVDGQRIFTMEDTAVSASPLLYIDHTGNTAVGDETFSRIVVGGLKISMASWSVSPVTYVNDAISHHLAVTQNGGSGLVNVYIDGVLVGSSAAVYSYHGRTTVIGGEKDTVTVNRYPFRGQIQDVMYFEPFSGGGELTAAEVLALYEAGYGNIEESSSARVERLLDYVSMPDHLREIDALPYATCGATNFEANQAVLGLIQKVEDTEQGIFFATRSGKLAFRNRYYTVNSDRGLIVQAYLDDANTKIGFRNLQFSYDADNLINDFIVEDDLGQKYQSENASSIDTYGRRSRTIQTLLVDGSVAREMAQSLSSVYSLPVMRATPFQVIPLSEEWLDILPLDIGERLNVQATPLGVGSAINLNMSLQQISYNISPKNWSVTIGASPRPSSGYFVLDSSELSGPDILGFI